MFSKLFVFLLVIVSLAVFIYSSGINYQQHTDIKRSLVNHPEFIPTSEMANLSAGGFGNIVADSYWLSAIQYIGSNALGSEYKAYLFAMLNLITDLNPYFTYPYQIGELLLPSYNERYENLSKEEIQKNTDQAIKIGLKGIEKNCDATKVEKARSEFNLKKLWTDESYQNTCRDPMIPYYLAYIYYWNLHDGMKSSQYYRIASTNSDAPTGARTMAAIMQGKSGDREKAIIMLLSIAESIEGNKNTLCQQLSKELGTSLFSAFSARATLTGQGLQMIESARQEMVKKLEEQGVDPTNGQNVDNFCSTYLNKAVREMNLSYLEQADSKYFQDKKEHAPVPTILLQNKYIDYNPIDFQQDPKNKQGIEYFYSSDNNAWDYRMGEMR
ncbi:hypothetical protein GW819_03610 [Candidatus Gracilibacteria bacterium]|nr:hypothetical protein [Candidatus Gracilibacteria bacterium]OIO75948.1 MAG: hypothetical protein AUJ87_03835 [Candidatus Gracilibacteria bacterium CG1_02_38_174]PIQ12128.1 MAG: hypothetical protein COW68_00840 [Candidatus Gracilibacteria bacterium CG18_big_fil_WC_8_21_14_2_50_38_16]PIQ41887.1 MAG: hypothetical protein COW06_01515 [Candidatus Gracilibacteria bacterium CG12_big_fil_rev_8_21_14_0_65_38_15]